MTTLQKYFENKTYLDVLEIMIKSVELEIPDFKINMNSFGDTEEISVKTGETFKTKIICFGCAATKTLFNIFHQENPEWTIFDTVEKSKIALNTNDNFCSFELLFDALRMLHIVNINHRFETHLSEFNHLLFPTDLIIPSYVSELTTENYKTEIQNWKLWLKELKK